MYVINTSIPNILLRSIWIYWACDYLSMLWLKLIYMVVMWAPETDHNTDALWFVQVIVTHAMMW